MDMMNFQPNQNYYPMMRNQPYMREPQQNGITWVQGIEGAKAWQLAPNSNALLMDSETDNRFYIKVSDNVGMCNLRIFEYNEITDKPTTPQIDLSNYVTRSELLDMLKTIKEDKVNVNKPLQSATSNKSIQAQH